MPIYLKQSTTSQEIPLGVFVDDTDGKSAEVGLTINNTDIKLWKTGATTLANKNSGGATHISGGIYYTVLDDTDTGTLGPMVVFVHVAGALPVRVETVVLAANIYDSLIGGGDVLDVSVTQFGGTNGTFASGRPEVNTTHAAGTAWGSGAITAAAIATNAIDADALAADVGTEIGTAVWATAARTLTANTNFNDPTAASIADAVWDEARSGHVAGGSFGEGVASVQGNVTGSVASVSGNVDGSVASVTAGVTVATNSDKTGYSVSAIGAGAIDAAAIATGAIDADALATDAVTEIADGVLNRDLSVGTDSGSATVRTMRQALRFLRNKWSISGSTLTVTKEDDATESWTTELTTNASADPVVGSDPASS